MHPFDSKVVRLNVGLVEDQDERELGLVQDAGLSDISLHASDVKANRLLPASVEHIRHEGRRSHSSGSVNDVGHNGRKGGSHSIGYDSS